MILTFDRVQMAKLLATELAGPKGAKPFTGKGWGCKAVKSHGLNLVGDQGIYFVCNRKMVDSPVNMGLVAYAKECNPTNKKTKFDDWWAVKNATFGGDDGVEFVTVRSVKAWLDAYWHSNRLRMDLNPGGYVLLGEQ